MLISFQKPIELPLSFSFLALCSGHVIFSRAQWFEGRLALNPGLKLTPVSFSYVKKHFLG